MARTLLVTNDFPPRAGGIQNYLQALVDRLPPGEIAVYAPSWPGAPEFDAAAPYPVHRHPTSLMLPVPTVARRAARLARAHGASTVWFGAAAPLALLGPYLRRHAGIRRVVASTHGHEVGWSMLPVARQALGRIGRDADVVTVVSRYTRGRFAAAFGPDAALEPLPPGVDAEVFRPDPQARAALRRRYGLGDAPVVTCVSRLVARKGQDQLLRVLPQLRARVPGTRLLLVGDGPGRRAAARGWPTPTASPSTSSSPGPCPPRSCPRTTRSATCSRCPAAPAAVGWTSRAWGSSCWRRRPAGLPVVAGDSGGAPETVREGVTGHVVGGRDTAALADALGGLLADPERARRMGAAGREWMLRDWAMPALVQRLRGLLSGSLAAPAVPGSRPRRAPSGRLVDPGVERGDVVGVLARHDRPPHLQRGGQLPALLGEVAGQDVELADLLGPRHRPVRLLDGGGDLAAQLGVVDEVGRRPVALGLAVLPPPPGQRLGVDVTSAAMKGCPSPTTRTCPTSGFARSRSSSTAGATFLPPAVTMISFLRPVMLQEPVVVELADVTGAEPAVGHRLGGGVRVVPW